MQIANVFPDFQNFISNFPKEWEINFCSNDYDENVVVSVIVQKDNIFVKVMLLRSNKTIIPAWFVFTKKKLSTEVPLFEKEKLIQVIEEVILSKKQQRTGLTLSNSKDSRLATESTS